MRILITGSSGFIGSNLVKQLMDKHLCFAPTHQELDLLSCHDVEQYCLKNSISMIIHCASVGGRRSTNYDANANNGIVEQNIRMFVNLVRTKLPIINMGSGAEYYTVYPYTEQGVKEGDIEFQYPPQNAYGFSKYAISKMINNNQQHIINLRLFGVFGPGEDYNFRFISNTIVRMLFNLPIEIQSDKWFGYLYIDDLVKVISWFIDHKNKCKFNTFNVSPQCYRLSDIASLVNRIMATNIPISIKASANMYYCGNSDKLKKTTKIEFEPIYVSILKLIEYYKKTIYTIDKDTIIRDDAAKFCK